MQPEEFVQILNTGKGHWVTASTIGVPYPVVRLYDSKFFSAGTSLEAQISCMLCTREDKVILDLVDVHIQAGIQNE